MADVRPIPADALTIGTRVKMHVNAHRYYGGPATIVDRAWRGQHFRYLVARDPNMWGGGKSEFWASRGEFDLLPAEPV